MYPTASCHRERESDIKTGHCLPTRTTSIHHHVTKAARIPRRIERRRNQEQGNLERPSGTRGAPAAHSPATSAEGSCKRQGGSWAWDFQNTAGPPGLEHPGSSWPGLLPTLLVPALLRPVGYSQEELLASRGNAFYFQLRNSHHHLGSC